MHVHVPQAGNQELPGSIDDAGVGCQLDGPADGEDPAAADCDGDVLARRCAGCIDDGRVLEDNILPRDNRKAGSESKQPVAQTILTCRFQISYSILD
jgi:hypothetical protein